MTGYVEYLITFSNAPRGPKMCLKTGLAKPHSQKSSFFHRSKPTARAAFPYFAMGHEMAFATSKIPPTTTPTETTTSAVTNITTNNNAVTQFLNIFDT